MNETRSQLDLEQSHAELHDLCQPLTALQCRLELTKIPGHDEPLEAAIDDSLQQTRRLFEVVMRMRERLLKLEQATESDPLNCVVGLETVQQAGKLESTTGGDHGDSEYRL